MEKSVATPGDAKHAVQLRNVRKEFGSTIGVNDLTLDIRQGEFLTLLGPSGCGKSTLLGMIAGFITPTAGRIVVDGTDLTHVEPYKRDIGLVFQNYALFPHVNVFDNVAFGLKMRKLPKAEIEERTRRGIAMMKLEGLEKRRVRQLSGGQQQRVAVARAVVIQPKVLLLDEPLSALDKNLRAQMQVELSELHRSTGLTTIFVTHDQGEALSLSDRIVVMNKGEVQQVAAPIELYKTPANGFVASFIGEINALPDARYSVDGDTATLAIQGVGELKAPRRPEWSFANGTTVRSFLRPEQVVPVEFGSTGPNHFEGVVEAHIYQGAQTITRVMIEGIGLIQTRVNGADIIARQPVGERMVLRFEADDAILLPTGFV
ncbi:ABC transporter ATP-binding protein [Tepidamorphus sp. 3E244]|uniref:ABC transporter ATP-binding protein n=1 Tax=Tepidamorphus sp. 3E244 TaxID=3385498 RepID=UPI0038FCB91B